MLKRLILYVLVTSSNFALSAEIAPFNGTLAPVSTQAYQLIVAGDGKNTRLSITDLENLTLYQANFKTKWDLEGDFVGVKLIDLLKHVGINTFKRVLIRASNDYKTTIESTDTGIDTALVATRLNGAPFKLTDKGPFFIIWPSLSEQLLSGEVSTAKWAWSAIEIQKVR
jgi:hypothetical protein